MKLKGKKIKIILKNFEYQNDKNLTFHYLLL
jgi:hypothetical protein